MLMRYFLPNYEFAEHHEIVIHAPADRVLDTVASLQGTDDPIVRALVMLRELPGWLLSARDSRNGPRSALSAFTLLGRTADEIAYGLAGRFWQLDYGLAPITDRLAFKAFTAPGNAKLVMGFQTLPCADGVKLVTRTHVHCMDHKALRSFRWYWLLIRLASGAIRHRILKVIKQKAERWPVPVAG